MDVELAELLKEDTEGGGSTYTMTIQKSDPTEGKPKQLNLLASATPRKTDTERLKGAGSPVVSILHAQRDRYKDRVAKVQCLPCIKTVFINDRLTSGAVCRQKRKCCC